jgi:CDP-paratose 2-epimerase
MSRALVTGGAGFVGTNLTERLLCDGREVVVLDDLSRQGVERNLDGLRARHGKRVIVEKADVADRRAVRRAMCGVSQIFHLAGQTAVTTSMVDPMGDAHVNLQGTLAVLEEMRRLDDPPSLIFTSTNKVYGDLDDVALEQEDGRYRPQDAELLARGVGSDRPLDFCTPYGCSKGAADQYVLDYAHSFGLITSVLRMSCIYGPHQCGNEDQGWVAHFLIRALEGEPITIYGDGRQVRDVLYVDDLVDAFLRVAKRAPQLRGRAFNVGGGPANAVSLLDVLEVIGGLVGPPEVEFGEWRAGDQRYYCSDTSELRSATGWRPRAGPVEGIRRLYEWLCRERGTRASASAASAA